MRTKEFLAGAAATIAARALLPRLLLMQFARDTKRINAGDHSALLANYADDAVLHFAPGEHRWAGDWVGKPAIDRFLQNFVAARIRGEIRQLVLSGPPWALTLWVRFDDHADAPNGTRIYENRTVLVIRTRWGKIVEHEDFYLDTVRMVEFDRRLTELGVQPIPRP